jgi:DNA-directed RNA polymerase subunit RPC12/RpoP
MQIHVECVYKCEKCEKEFMKNVELSNHMYKVHAPNVKETSKQYNYEEVHAPNVYKCKKCEKEFMKNVELSNHMHKVHALNTN